MNCQAYKYDAVCVGSTQVSVSAGLVDDKIQMFCDDFSCKFVLRRETISFW